MHATALDTTTEASAFESARENRSLTREEAAAQAGLSVEEVAWLEDGRLYRYRSPQDALAAAVAYATGLGIEHREALELAGRPVPPADPARRRPRLLAAAAVALVVVALAAAVTLPRLRSADDSAAQANLPPPWRVSVQVLNGAGDIEYTNDVADRIGAAAYHVERVRKADRFDYPETAVYYPPGAKPLGERLADELCVPLKPLPGGDDKRRLVVIVGPAEAVSNC